MHIECRRRIIAKFVKLIILYATAVDQSFKFCLHAFVRLADDAWIYTQCISFTVIVVFSVQPFAVTNCSTSLKVNKGGDVVCLCNSKVGNPPPTASWYKNGMVVNGAGDLKNMLSLKNISRNDNENYSCVVKSLDLSHATEVVIQVQCK